MFTVKIYYEDISASCKYSGVNKIGYWVPGGGFEYKQGDEILTYHFSRKQDLVLYADTYCVTISSNNIRCIEISKN